MPAPLAPQTRPPAPPARSAERDLWRSEPVGTDSLVAGAVTTVLLHLLLLWLLPADFAKPRLAAEKLPRSTTQYEVNFLEPVPLPPPPPPPEPSRFVETNPDVPENVPDETPNFAARNQQSAQPEPAPVTPAEQVPRVEGEEEEFNKIVQGELLDPAEQSPPPGIYQPTNPSQESAASPAQPPREPAPVAPQPQAPPPAPDFLEGEPGDGEGLASYLEPGEGREPVEEPSPEKPIDVSLNPFNAQPLPSLTPRPEQAAEPPPQAGEQGPPVPLPRPRLVPKVAPGPLRHAPGGVTRAGLIAIDANFSEFGDYLQRMFDAVGLKWNQLNESALRSYAEMNSRVVVEFAITRYGEVVDLRVVFTSADRLRTLLCVDAIKSRAPYGEWTTDMVQVLGEVQPIRFTFLYR